MTRKVANSGKYGYKICDGTRGYSVALPLVDGTEIQQTFSSKSKAERWQLSNAKKHWGLDRFQLLKRGRLSILRKFGCGVSVRRVVSKMTLSNGDVGEYPQFGVFWYEHDKSPKSKFFSYKRYGDDAEREAHWFAAKQRAILTCSELNLPPELITPDKFDHASAVKINVNK